MGIPEPAGLKINILKDMIMIAGVAGDAQTAEKALAQMVPANTALSARAGNNEVIRQTKADNTFWTAMVAIAKGDYSAATAGANEYRQLREPDRDPSKMRPYYNLAGMIALKQKRYDEAEKDLAQSNPYNMVVQFSRAQALEALGRTDEAKALYRRVAGYNFNDGTYAAVRALAIKKAQ
jgi:tetratricopeptide (TPR) repeat protein